MSELPEGWVSTTLGECFRWRSGGTPTRTIAEYYGGGIPWAVIGDLNDGLVMGTQTTISEEGLTKSSAKWAAMGSVLLAMYGSIGKLGIAGTALTTNQAIAHTHPKPLPSRYLFWYLRSIRSQLLGLGKGGTQKNISQTVIKTIAFPLAPLPEQRRIVAKIESLFARLDEGVAALKRAEANLERYRASVLKAAVEGRLTEGWRRDNPPEETGEDLLRRILDERRKRWEAEQLAKFEAKGRKPPKNWRTNYKEPVAPDTSRLPGLPEGWCWATVEQFASTASGGTPDRRAESYFGGGIPWVKSGELGDGAVFASAETISDQGLASSSAKVFPAGTLCIALYGATVGKLGLLRMDAATNQAVCGILSPIAAIPEYLFFSYGQSGQS
ncbi:MAG: restriction endonuclease subunit S [bacterium]|nr:restriction endonuclease subunit S [bacterium]